MVLELPKIVHIVQICVDLSKKSKSNKAVYLYPSERSYPSETGNVFSTLCYIYIYIYIYVNILHLSEKSNKF